MYDPSRPQWQPRWQAPNTLHNRAQLASLVMHLWNGTKGNRQGGTMLDGLCIWKTRDRVPPPLDTPSRRLLPFVDGS